MLQPYVLGRQQKTVWQRAGVSPSWLSTRKQGGTAISADDIYLVDGVRIEVARHGYSWAVEGEQGVEAIAAEVELEDGSLWWAVRNLRSGRWTGERIEVGMEDGSVGQLPP